MLNTVYIYILYIYVYISISLCLVLPPSLAPALISYHHHPRLVQRITCASSVIPSLFVWLWSHYQIKHGRATVEYGQAEGRSVVLCCK